MTAYDFRAVVSANQFDTNIAAELQVDRDKIPQGQNRYNINSPTHFEIM